jgi:hypothetical protein
MALIGLYFPSIHLPPLRSQEIDVGIAIRKDKTDRKGLFYRIEIDL